MGAVGVVGPTRVGVREQPPYLKQRPPTHLQMLSKIAGREKTGETGAQASRAPLSTNKKSIRAGNLLKKTPLPPQKRPPKLLRSPAFNPIYERHLNAEEEEAGTERNRRPL